MDAFSLLGKLPRFRNHAQLVQRQQSVYDIMEEVLDAHRDFAPDYNAIAKDFWTGNVSTTAKKLFDFCKANVPYKIEGEGRQTTKSPAAILTQRHGDCKHYAGWIAGVFDAINRLFNAGIDWNYRFASYNLFDRTPAHVFIVAYDGPREIWIDPVLPRFDQRLEPVYFDDKKVSAPMALMRISGTTMGDAAPPTFPISHLVDDVDYASNPVLYMAFQRLLKYGILDANGKVFPAKFVDVQKKVSPADLQQLILDWSEVNKQAAFADSISGARVGGLFDGITRIFAVAFFAVPRGAYLSLVAINAFGYATKLQKAIYNDDGTYTPFKDQIKDKWQNKFGGQWTILENTINQGATHKAILGAVPAAVPAWVLAATAIIAALTPIITAALKARQTATGIDYNTLDPNTGLPYGTPQTGTTSTGGQALDFIKNNPAILIGVAAVGVYLYTKYEKKHHGGH